MKVVIFGAGGMAKEIIGYMETDHRDFEIQYVVANEPFNNPRFDFEVRKRANPDDDYAYILAVMDPAVKRKIVAENEDRWATYIHDSACVSSYAEVGRGSVFAPWTLITGDGRCGRFVFLNSNAAIGHDCSVGDYSSLLPYAELLGHSELGADCIMGTNSYLYHGVRVPDGSRLSVGSVVRTTPEGPATHYGDPRGAWKVISHQ